MRSGIINVYKEGGYTSFDVVAVLRKTLGIRKIGHTGTLDPMAEGVLPICVGKATRVVDLLTDKSKTYEAVMLLGKETDTEDITGEVLSECDERVLSGITEERVKDVLLSFCPEYDQLPPMYSAIKKDGKKLYELAREGKTVEREKRHVLIHEIRDIKKEGNEVSFTVFCGKGTYIRSLCRDAGNLLGCKACLKSLKRTTVGDFSVDDALRLSKIKDSVSKEDFSFIRPIDSVFLKYERFDFATEDRKIVLNGGKIPSEKKGFFRCYLDTGEFMGIYKGDGSLLKPEKLFYEFDQ